MKISDAIRIAVSCAEKYDTELCGKCFLILYQENINKINSMELVFQSQYFMHLTGLKARNKKHPISAPDFYRKCLDNRLRENEVTFSEDGTTELKLSYLPNILCKNLLANSVGDFNGSTVKLMTEKIVGNQHAFIGTIYIEEFGYYIPNTFVKGDIRDYGKNRKRIVSIFRRKQTEAEYTEITYLAKNVNWDNITFPVKYNLLLDKIKMDNGTHS